MGIDYKKLYEQSQKRVGQLQEYIIEGNIKRSKAKPLTFQCDLEQLYKALIDIQMIDCSLSEFEKAEQPPLIGRVTQIGWFGSPYELAYLIDTYCQERASMKTVVRVFFLWKQTGENRYIKTPLSADSLKSMKSKYNQGNRLKDLSVKIIKK